MPTVLILGATSDIAAAIAAKFASNKYDIQLAARNVSQLTATQSDLQIRYQVSCSLHSFDALRFETHTSFFDQLTTKPDVTICVFGLLVENETARQDWSQAASIIHTNFTGAVSILNVISNYYQS